MPARQKLRGWATGSRRAPPARAAPSCGGGGGGGVLQVPKPHPTHRLRKKDAKSSLNVSTTPRAGKPLQGIPSHARHRAASRASPCSRGPPWEACPSSKAKEALRSSSVRKEAWATLPHPWWWGVRWRSSVLGPSEPSPHRPMPSAHRGPGTVRGLWSLVLRSHPDLPCTGASGTGRFPSLRTAGHRARRQRLVRSHVGTGPASAIILLDDLNYGYFVFAC